MQPFPISTPSATGIPALGLLPSLLFAAIGAAIIVTVVVKLLRESSDDPDRRGDESAAPSPDSDADAEQTGEDVV